MVLAVIALGLIFAATQNVIAAEAEVKLEAENNDEGITLEDLQQLEPFPEFYDQLSPEARLDWLNTQIDQAATPVQNYNYQRALAFEHFFTIKPDEASSKLKEINNFFIGPLTNVSINPKNTVFKNNKADSI